MYFYKTLVGEALLKVIAIASMFFVTPILLRFFSVEEYGIYGYCLSLVSLFAFIQNWGSADYVNIYYIVEKDGIIRKNILGNSYLISIFMNILLVLVVFLLSFSYESLFTIEIQYFYTILIIGCFTILTSMLTNISQYKKMIFEAYLTKALASVLGIMSVVITVLFDLTVLNLLWSLAIVSFINFGIILYFAKDFSLSCHLNVSNIRPYTGRYFLIIINSLLLWVMFNIDKYFVSYFLGKEELGILVFIIILSTLVVEIVFSFFKLIAKTNINIALLESNFTLLKNTEKSFIYFISLVLQPIILGLSIYGAPFIILYAGDNYSGAHQYIIFTLLALYSYSISYYYREGLVTYNVNNMKDVLKVTFACVLIIIVLNLILIPFYGIYGAVIINLLGCFVYSVSILIVYSRKVFNAENIVLFKMHFLSAIVWGMGWFLWSDDYGIVVMFGFCIITMLSYWALVFLIAKDDLMSIYKQIN